ncbi:MAG: BrnT family toxin [Treponema sp.]|nr:BrnT family toxin [Treponema sp.]
MEEFEWDNNKASSNMKKHDGLTFEMAEEVFEDPFAIEKYDEINSTIEEDRFIVLGRIKNQLVVVTVYTPKNGKRRIISARYATSNERRLYYGQFAGNYGI